VFNYVINPFSGKISIEISGNSVVDRFVLYIQSIHTSSIGSNDATSNHPTVYLAGTTANSEPSSFHFGYPDPYPITAVKGVTYSNPIAISRTEQIVTTRSRYIKAGESIIISWSGCS
jgi:hypothetical protein